MESKRFFYLIKKEDSIEVRISGDLAQISWDEEEINRKVNFLEEDLYLRIRSEEGDFFLEKCVSHLTSTECNLPQRAGLLHVELFSKRRLSLRMDSSFYYTPSVKLVSENERRHHLYWQDIDWDAIRDEVKALSHIDWESSIDVCLHIRRWPDEVARLPLEEYVSPGVVDHFLILGSLKEVSLEVWTRGAKGRETFLKEIFTLSIRPGERERQLGSLSFKYPGKFSFLRLKREIWEGDSVQLRAYWSIRERDWVDIQEKVLDKEGLFWDDVYLSIRLYALGEEGEVEWRPDEVREIIPGTTDWLFTGIERGKTYRAVLVISEKGPGTSTHPIMESNLCSIPFEENRITLMPIDEYRIYSYWHIDQGSIRDSVEELSKDGGEIKAYIKVYHDFGGNLYHHPDKDVEIHLDIHDNWYLNVDPDKVYRAEIILVSPAGRTLSLTPVSNPVQTMRTETGGLQILRQTLFRGHPALRRV